MGLPAFLHTTYLATATVGATDSAPGSDPGDVLFATEDTAHRPADAVGQKTYTIDLGEPRTIDAVALVGLGLDGVTVALEGADDAGFTVNKETTFTGLNLDAPVNAGWGGGPAYSHRYWRIYCDNIPSNFSLAWVCLCLRTTTPSLKGGNHDPANISGDGRALVSPSGMFLGTTRQQAMAEFPLDFGIVNDDAEFAALNAWAQNCIAAGNPFVFVPDQDATRCHFAWIDPAQFSARTRGGVRRVRQIKVTTRVK